MTFQLCYASKTTSPHHQILNDLRDILVSEIIEEYKINKEIDISNIIIIF